MHGCQIVHVRGRGITGAPERELRGEMLRWPGGMRCIFCGSEMVMKTGVHGKYVRAQCYHCKACNRWFNDKSIRIFANSNLPLRAWFFAAFLLQFKDKVPVVVAARRKSGRVRIQPNRKVKGRMVIRRYQRGADPGARVYTDDFPSYNALPGDKHLSVKHDEDEYSDGNGVHINTAEAEFSVFRPWIATFRDVSKKKLYLYIRHYEFLRNHRDIDSHRKNPKNAVNFAYPLPTKMLPTINHASMDVISYKGNISEKGL